MSEEIPKNFYVIQEYWAGQYRDMEVYFIRPPAIDRFKDLKNLLPKANLRLVKREICDIPVELESNQTSG